MYKIGLISILLLSTSIVFSQRKHSLAFEEYKIGLNPIDEIQLFDKEEIKARKIDTVYLIYHPGSWAEYDSLINPCTCSYNDTLCRYVFDKEGRLRQYTSFNRAYNQYSTEHYDSAGNYISYTTFKKVAKKIDSSTHIFSSPDSTQYREVQLTRADGKDSVKTTIGFWKFKHGIDTAFIEMRRYNQKGKLTEEQSEINKRNARELDDDTGEWTYHYNYDYDNEGRLIHYQDVRSNEYEKISYPFWGKLTEVYNSTTNELKYRKTKLIKEEGIITITFDRKQIILTPLESGSKLFKLRTIVETGEIPLLYYHEFIYKTR